MDPRPSDGLAPDSDGLWQAIEHRLADIEQGLSWGDLVQTRTALQDLPGALRMMGIAQPARVAETFWVGFQADPRDPARLSEFAALQAALRQARHDTPEIPLSAAAMPASRALIASAGPLAESLRGLRLPGWRFTLLMSPAAAAVWLRMGDVAAIVWDPADERFPAEWLQTLPPQLPIISLGAAPDGLAVRAVAPDVTVADLVSGLNALPARINPQFG